MVVLARMRRQDHILGGQGTLMSQCLFAGLPVASSCAGRGACGKCIMTVLEGMEALSAPEPHESLVLARYHADSSERLGCQCRVRIPSTQIVVTTGYW